MLSDEPVIDPKFLDRCFFIIDEMSNSFDEGEEDLMMLYFYPPSVEFNSRIYLLGACQAMQNFVENFTKDPVSVLALEKHRLAFHHIGDLIMVLSSPISESCTSLQQRLSRIANWFIFNYGSYDKVREPYGTDRRALIEHFQKIGASLTEPFDTEEDFSKESGLPKIFQPIKFAELPNFLGSRIFSGANQMLWNALCADEDALAGCILCDGLVLCTQFDVPTTDTVVIRSNIISKTNTDPKYWEYVYLKKSQIEELKKLGCAVGDDDYDDDDNDNDDEKDEKDEKDESVKKVGDDKKEKKKEDDDDDDKEVSFVKKKEDKEGNDEEEEEEEIREEEEVIKSVLCVFTYKSVCMSLLLSLERDDSEDSIKRRVDDIHASISAELVTFDDTFTHAKELSSKSASSSGSLSSVHGDQSSGPAMGSSPASRLTLSQSVSASTSPAQQSGAQSNMVVPIKWALYDSLTGSLKQNQCPVQLTKAQSESFYDMVALAHDTLALPGVTQVYLRRSNGSILSRDLFSKQLHWFTHYHIAGHERFTEFFETNRNNAFKNSPDGQMF